MKLVIASDIKKQKRFLKFRKDIYTKGKKYVDNGYYMVKEIFSGKLHFTKALTVIPAYVTDGGDNGRILCEGIIAYSKELPEYVQLCFFEALKDQQEAVDLLLEKAREVGKELSCKKIVAGLYGHVNYGLGFLSSNEDSVNSFSSNANPLFYNDYFRKRGFDEIGLNTYHGGDLENKLSGYQAILRKLDRNYEFKNFSLKEFDEYARIYTELNNKCFAKHRYYFKSDLEDNKEMLRDLFMFMKEDSLIFAYHKGKPVAFIMWYPDYNLLAKPGEIFGAKHYFLNKLCGNKIRTAKVMEYGVLDEYRGVGLPLALINKVYLTAKKRGFEKLETSWILEENLDSNSFCKEVCEGLYKKYSVYEKDI
jgi:GNAT superfamily N-acetyltransferase